ncbi:TetR family transcriptional regulator [Aneurinibacillus soli]|uniref:HTH-type transcriptional regulator AcrR n=1 Tax=Aneurinibacillus soli TaxID=1500254 RepID=A0A0U5B3N4_9BACL|nr:TetR/AcrR family transcriptional regulator [Aneurinibacillus soli]PYE64034.1 TetR family transcriptional regulator [Aneurinibacillus soli]BAU27983.1 HTH-type transcriptional regulator AcrR [Aneurinibacillus soli]
MEYLRDTKEKIIKEARRLFAERGYSATTTAEIARRVGVTDAALYKHFKGKKDIFLACVTPSATVRVDMDAELSPELLRDLIRERVELVRGNLENFNILFRESPYHPELARMFWSQLYTQGKYMEDLLNKFSNKDVSSDRILMYELAITSAIWFILNYEKLQEDVIPKKVAFEDIEEKIADFVLYGMLGDKKHR